MTKRKRNQTPKSEFHQALMLCSCENDFSGALALYRAAADSGICLTSHHFNTLLHICSNTVSSSASAIQGELSPPLVAANIEEAFNIFNHMVASGIPPTESTITSMVRIAAVDKLEGGNRAFELVREMQMKHGVMPRLRTYGPPLFAFCHTADGADRAYDVESHMISMGISPEEPELAALLNVSVEAMREEKVYEYLHKLRRTVGCVSPSTVDIIKRWFESESAVKVGKEVWNVDEIQNTISLNGGGWHGNGWLGKGKWRVQSSNVDSNGYCSGCGQQLTCVDIDWMETKKFADDVASLAMAREVNINFRDFQGELCFFGKHNYPSHGKDGPIFESAYSTATIEDSNEAVDWLNNHSECDVVVDGANVAYYHQNFADGGFNLTQVEAVVKELVEGGYGRRPLIILHNKRIMGLMENENDSQLLKEWKAQDSLYATPNGSNDDWYWLYASVKLKCLLVTNDEMRDHIFELLGRDFFSRWKEAHQVKYTFIKDQARIRMPPPYTSVIQESKLGSWHLPVSDCEHEKQRTWICITREGLC